MRAEIEMSDILKPKAGRNDNTEDEEEEEEEEEMETTCPPSSTPARRLSHFEEIGSYCLKCVYVTVVLGLFTIVTSVLYSQTQIKIEDIIIDRARDNKRAQVIVVSSMMESLTEAIHNARLKEAILLHITANLNRHYLTGSYEVVLVKRSGCISGGQCGVRIISDLRHVRRCATNRLGKDDTSPVDVSSHRCNPDAVASIGGMVLASPSAEAVGTILFDDYIDGTPLAFYAYKQLKGTDMGLILKQSKTEALLLEDTQSSVRWYTAIVVVVVVVVLGFLLIVVLQHVEEGKGYIPIVGLHLLAVGGVLGLVVLMAFVASLDEGLRQQRAETASTGALFLGTHESVAQLLDAQDGIVTAAMFDGLAIDWVKAVNERLPPAYEGHMFSTVLPPAGGTMPAAPSYLVSNSSMRRPCAAPTCVAAFVSRLENLASSSSVSLTMPDNTRFKLRLDAVVADSYSPAEAAAGVQHVLAAFYAPVSGGERKGFAWMVDEEHVARPYKAAVDDLWSITGAMVAAYVVASVVATALTCHYLPKISSYTDGGAPVRLSRVLPFATVLSITFVLVLLAVSGVAALRGMSRGARMYKQVAYGNTVVVKASELSVLFSQMHSVSSSALVTGSAATGEKFVALTAASLNTIGELHNYASMLYDGDEGAAAVPLVVAGLPALLTDVAEGHLRPAMSGRATMTLKQNASYVMWAEAPDTSVDSATMLIDEAKAELVASGISPAANQYAALLDAENTLYDLQVLYREYVILNTGAASRQRFDDEYAALSAKFTLKIDAVASDINVVVKQASEAAALAASTGTPATVSTAGATFDVAKFAFSVVNIKSNIEQHKRDSNRFNMVSIPDVQKQINEVISKSLGSTQLAAPALLLKDDLSHEATTRELVVKDFFTEMKLQMKIIAANAQLEASSHAHLQDVIELERIRVKRATTFSLILIIVTCFVIAATLIWYMKDARCNTGPGGKCLAPYPWIEMRDMTIIVSVVMVVYVTQAGLIRHFALTHHDMLDTRDHDLTVATVAQKDVGEWLAVFHDVLAVSSTYLMTGDAAYKRGLDSIHEKVKRQLYATSLINADNAVFDVLKEQSEEATEGALHLVEEVEEHWKKRGLHSYDTVRLLVRDRQINPSVVAFNQQISEQQRITTQSREEWVTSYSKAWGQVQLTCDVERTIGGVSIEKWSPRVVTLDVGLGYDVVLTNNFDGPVELDLGQLLRNAAVKRVYSADTEWVVPYATLIRLNKGSVIHVEFIVVKTGVYELMRGNRTLVSVQALGEMSNTGLDPGISAVAEKRLTQDLRSNADHPLWDTWRDISFYVPPLSGGFHAEQPYQSEENRYIAMMETDRAYRITQHNGGPLCSWLLEEQGRFCSDSVSIALGKGIALDECQMLSDANPACGDHVSSDGSSCSCLLRGVTCDYQYGQAGTSLNKNRNVYVKTCSEPTTYVGRVTRVAGIDLRSMEGHVIVRDVGDRHASLNVPHVVSMGHRYNDESPSSPKSTYVNLVTLTEGYYPLKAIHSAHGQPGLKLYEDLAGVTRGCFQWLDDTACYRDMRCVWDGRLCTQREVLPVLQQAQVAQSQNTVPENVLSYLLMAQSMKQAAAFHLAYLLSDAKHYLETSRRYEEYFARNASKVSGEASRNLQTSFEEWVHALDMERMVRDLLSTTQFIEDLFVSDRGNSAAVDEVNAQANALMRPTRRALAALLDHSRYETRFVYWSCCVVAWATALAGTLIFSRLDMAVRLSQEYSYHNIPSAADFVAPPHDDDESSEEEPDS